MIDVTQLYCPESGGEPGEDSTTHHLRPRSAGGGAQRMVCAYCGKTEAELRAAAAVTGS